MPYTADQVWALAIRANTINGGYLKEAEFSYNDQDQSTAKTKEANKVLVRLWLRESVQPTEEEVQQGRECRQFFNSFTLKALGGKITDFEKAALRISQRESFEERDVLDISIVSCLPSAAAREKKSLEIKREISHSTHLEGQRGESIIAEGQVVYSTLSTAFFKYKVLVCGNGQFFDFWHGRDIPAGSKIRVKGKIKQHRDNNTTQLNYVKVLQTG